MAGVERGAPALVDNRARCLVSRQRPRARPTARPWACHLPPVEVFRCGPGRSPRWSHVNAAVRAGQRPGCMPSMSAGRSMAGLHALRLDNGPGRGPRRGDGPSPSTCRGLPARPWAIAAMVTCQRSCAGRSTTGLHAFHERGPLDGRAPCFASRQRPRARPWAYRFPPVDVFR